MGVEIKGFRKANKVYTAKKDLLKIQLDFAPILVSSHQDHIWISDKAVAKGYRLLSVFVRVSQLVYNAFGYITRVNSGYRTFKINKLLPGSSKTSQHPFWEALDLAFYDKQGNRILDKDVLLEIFNLIVKCMGGELAQVLFRRYGTFIHVGLVTTRRKLSIQRS